MQQAIALCWGLLIRSRKILPVTAVTTQLLPEDYEAFKQIICSYFSCSGESLVVLHVSQL